MIMVKVPLGKRNVHLMDELDDKLVTKKEAFVKYKSVGTLCGRFPAVNP